MNGIKQLFKGVIIGMVLLLAIIGLLNISGTSNDDKVLNDINNANKPDSTLTQNDIKAPSINITQPADNPASMAMPQASNDHASREQTNTHTENTKAGSFKPEIIEQPVSYGTLHLSTKSIDNNSPQKVTFMIFDENNKRVANINNSTTASFRLKTGQYKAIAQFSQNNQQQNLALDITIEQDKTTRKVFTIKSLINTGILQVLAVSGTNKKPAKIDFIIHDQQGKRVATRQHVASTLFKLKSGTYQITATGKDSHEQRTITIKPGSSNKEIFNLTAKNRETPPRVATHNPAKILLRAIDENSNTPLKANFSITDKDGKLIKRFNATASAELSVGAGDYQIQATGPDGQSSRKITLQSGQTLSETFRFKANNNSKKPEPEIVQDAPAEKAPANVTIPEKNLPTVTADTAASHLEPDQKNNNHSVTRNDIPKEEPTIEKEKAVKQAMLRFKTVDSKTKKPIKSNFYVQTLNGKHIVNKIYSETASFKLDKGVYRITVKSNNKKTISKTVSLDENSRINRIFSMVSNQAPKPTNVTQRQNAQQETTKTTPKTSAVDNEPYYSDKGNKPVPTPSLKPPANGTLLVAMYPAKNHKTSRNTLLSNFLIKTKSGKKIALINRVQHAKVKLDVGDYVVTAIHKNRNRSTTFKIRKNQNTTVSFNAANFRPVRVEERNTPRRISRNKPAPSSKGILRSRIIDQHGNPLKGNLIITDRSGKIVGKANNVSSARFELPPRSFTIKLDYQGLNGSEHVNIVPGETTIQTFTISQ